jgi:very-short-patch-repair endonuclease
MNPEVRIPKYIIARARELRVKMTYTEKLLALEIDGAVHDNSAAYDKYRNEFLESLNIGVDNRDNTV